MVNNLPATQETWIWSLGQEDPLEKGMATHFSILAWEIPWTEEPGGYSPRGHKELDKTEQLSTHTITYMGKEPEKNVYIQLNHFGIHLKLTQHHKSAILKFKIKNS